MERVNRILQNGDYRRYLKKNQVAEDDRVFCHHNMEHFLDVARIAMIINLEKGLCIPKDIIYATALLHDIGRWQEYETGVPHEVASARMAPAILESCGYTKEENRQICNAILSHRDRTVAEGEDLNAILYAADKLSRPCHSCEASGECNWSNEKKNLTIKY